MKLLFLFLILSFANANAQNLVPNHSFEQIDSCPIGHFMAADPWLVQNWQVPPGSITTPDLFSTCFNGTTPIFPHQDISVPINFMGNATPKTGGNYMGFLLKYGEQTGGEYLQTQLSSPLLAGQKYLCGFHIQRADSSFYVIDKAGMHISTVQEMQVSNQPMIGLTPQVYNTTGIMYDSLSWLKIENIFVASGGEEFITIGNFYDNANTQSDSINIDTSQFWFKRGYYLLDDVYIYPYQENLQVNFPEQVCRGETVTISAQGSAKYEWYIDGVWYSSDSIFTFLMEESINVSVAGYEDSLTYLIEVTDCPIDCSGEPIIPNVFTPNNDGVNDYFIPNNINSGCYTITILNRWGNVIYQGAKTHSFWDGASQNGERVSEGVYFYIIEVEENLGVKRKYHGYLRLIKEE